MNPDQRRLLIERDGRECQNCHGACPYRTDGLACKLVAKTLPAVTYWKLDRLRAHQPWLRLQVDHLDGKRHEEWDRCWTLCDCCHKAKVQGGGAVYDRGVAYLATVGPEPEEYRIAREQEAADKPKRKAARKQARKAVATLKAKVRRPTKASRRAPDAGRAIAAKLPNYRLPKKTLEQIARPCLNG